MKLKTGINLALGAGLVSFIAFSLFASPQARWRAFSAVEHACVAVAPNGFGSAVGEVLQPLFGSFPPMIASVDPGLSMRLDPKDLVARSLLLDRVWEPRSQAALAGALKPGGVFIDVGAHIGYYSLRASTVVGPTGHILSVEPNPATLVVLRENVALNHAPITVLPFACSDREAMLDLFEAGDTNTGRSSLSKANAEADGDGSRKVGVRARPLDDLVREAGLTRLDAMKIDVEGAELLVLRGAKETLTRFSPLLVIEVVDYQLRQMGASEKDLVAHLESIGYHLRERLGQNVVFTR